MIDVQQFKFPRAAMKYIIGIFAILIFMHGGIGINNMGYRTVVQLPNGTTFVKFDAGWYFKLFGSTEEYPDVITYDYDHEVAHDKNGSPIITAADAAYDKAASAGTVSDIGGVKVRYQDGGRGWVYGKDRFSLPNDEKTMLAIHKAFRNKDGVAQKLIRSVVKEAHNLTAGLMSSEGAYAELRGTYIQWVEDQIENGKFVTRLEDRTITDVDGKKNQKLTPVIVYNQDGTPKHYHSDLLTYGVKVSGSQITNWDFEGSTLDQISLKRNATMSIITARANAERAKQDAITAEAEGMANVMKAKYEKEVEKAKAVVDANKEKEIAVINAKREVDVAEQKKLQAIQEKLAALETKQQLIALGEGESSRKRMVMEADGALSSKLATYEKVMNNFAVAVGKQKWVPEVFFGGQAGAESNQASALINMLSVQTAKQLSLDMSMTQKK